MANLLSYMLKQLAHNKFKHFIMPHRKLLMGDLVLLCAAHLITFHDVVLKQLTLFIYRSKNRFQCQIE